MAYRHPNTRPTIRIQHVPAYYDRGVEVIEHTRITCDGDQYTVWGERAGNLYVFFGGKVIDMGDDVTDHAGAVDWCERQFTRTAVQV